MTKTEAECIFQIAVAAQYANCGKHKEWAYWHRQAWLAQAVMYPREEARLRRAAEATR